VSPRKGFRARSRTNLQERLRSLLDDGTGRINPALQCLFDHLIAMPEPGRCSTWLRNNPRVPALLQGLACGEIALTHEGLHELPSPRTTAHLRDLLMACGALPPLDRQLLLFEQWALDRLGRTVDSDDERILRQFVSWDLLATLRTVSRRRSLTSGHRNSAATALVQAEHFLAWIRTHSRTLRTLTQADADRFCAAHPDSRHELRRFLTWAMRNQHLPRLRTTSTTHQPRQPITQRCRLMLINRMLTDTTIELPVRVAALLVLLFAQPVSALLRLTIQDIQVDEQDVTLRLGEPPTPVPEPFAKLLQQLLVDRPNMNTANVDSPWLFPGGRAGQPLNPSTQARTAAFRQLTLQAPAPVVADALGCHHHTAHRHHHAAGDTWNHYPTIKIRRRAVGNTVSV
jgi:hypothetical protein